MGGPAAAHAHPGQASAERTRRALVGGSPPPAAALGGHDDPTHGRLSELAWEDHLLPPTLVPAELQPVEFAEDDWRVGAG